MCFGQRGTLSHILANREEETKILRSFTRPFSLQVVVTEVIIERHIVGMVLGDCSKPVINIDWIYDLFCA